MAAPSYTTDLLPYMDATSLTGITEPAGMTNLDGAGVVDTDLAVYGTTCISEAMRKSGLGALVYTGTQPTWTAGETCYFAWFKWFAPNSLGLKVTEGGIRFLVGNTDANYYGWYLDGSDTYDYGGWKNYVIDPTQTALSSQTQGTPTTTYNTVGIGVNCPVSSPSKGNSYTLDIIRYGRGVSLFTNGDLANGYATFDGFAIVNDNATTGRWGLFQDVGGSYLWKGLMSLGEIGTPVDFRDSNVSFAVDNTEFVGRSFNKIEVYETTSHIEWDTVNITSLSTRSPGTFEMIDNATVTKSACSFTDMDYFIYQNNATIINTTYRRCFSLDQGTASFEGCTFANPSTAESSSFITASDPGLFTNCVFSTTGTGHAIEATVAGTYGWVGNEDTGYAGGGGTNLVSNSGPGNATFFNNSGGLITLNASDGSTSPSVRNGVSATTVINNTVNYTISNLVPGTEVRIYPTGSTDPLDELDGVESSSTSFVYSYNYAGDQYNDIVIHNIGYVYIRLENVFMGNTNSGTSVQQQVDRWYNNPVGP